MHAEDDVEPLIGLTVPTAHDTQLPDDRYVPEGHEQFADPGPDTNPKAQVTQLDDDTDPTLLLDVPGAHREHDDAPVVCI